jgi:hypothetical protein
VGSKKLKAMKNIYKLSKLALLAFVLVFPSCDYEDEVSTSLITNYAVITFEGGDPLYVPLGGEFTETAVATIDGNEVAHDNNYVGRYRGNQSSTLDTSIADVYTAEYSAVNDEGFVGTTTRDIIVANTGDLINSIEGVYRATVSRNGTVTAQYTDLEYVLIWKNEDGTYQISDAFGGYYDFGRDYGIDYITPDGVIVANDIATNDFTFPNTLTNGAFGGSAEITSLEVNATNKTLDMVTVWVADAQTTYTFEIHLEQVQF